MSSSKTTVVIISPALAQANNGNWRTAHRWHRFLSRRHAVTIAAEWHAEPGVAAPDLMIALHALRSAASLEAFVAAYPDRPAILVLTGTDVYRDIAIDATAMRSLVLATKLVLLEPEGITRLPAAVRGKAEVIVQSAPTLAPRSPDRSWFDLLMVAYLRDEKDPETTWRAFERVSRLDRSIRLIQVGGALDARYDAEARALAARNDRFRWLGELSHALARQQIRRARALVISSVMEGGAHVLIEAITSGVPVFASDIPGNLGLLGRHYAGTFPVGDDGALAALIERARRDPDFLLLLKRQCAERAPLFRPERERDRLITLVDSCISAARAVSSTTAPVPHTP
ncbi:MAG: selenoneine biosynthesis selenosugar synthase SenB [Burkholderiaceae bacterium]